MEKQQASFKNTFVSAGKKKTKQLSTELAFPFFFHPTPSFSVTGRTRAPILATSCAARCHPREPDIGNETGRMQSGFKHLEHTLQQAAGECDLEFPSDASENAETIKKPNGLSNVSVRSGFEQPAGVQTLSVQNRKTIRSIFLLLYESTNI